MFKLVFLIILDTNECLSSDLNQCDHICTNTNGSYTCSCNTGYRLLVDGKSCQGLQKI